MNKNKKKSNIISYIGSKVNLMDFLEEKMFQKYQKKPYTFYDLFAGTNSVSKHIVDSKNKKNWNVVTNDIHNYSYRLSYFMNSINIKKDKRIDIINLLNELNELPLIDTGIFFNEFSVNGNITTANDLEKMFSNQKVKTRLFFPEIVGKKIDTIRAEIFKWKKEGKINTIEENILFIFLLSYADKNANTTSVYGAYLKDDNKAVEKKLFYNEDLINEFLDMKISKKTRNITHYNENISDILTILNEKNSGSNALNIVYLDPPYSTRSYEGNYHVLEYISKENFSIYDINPNSKTAQPSNQIENPFRKKGETLNIFKKMIRESLRFSDNVYISYSTDGLVKEEEVAEYVKELKKEFPTLIFNKDLKLYKKYKSSHKDSKSLVIELNSLLHKNNKNIEDINKISQLENLIKESKEHVDGDKETELYEILWHFSIPPKGRNKKGEVDKIFETNKDKILEFKNNGLNLKKQVEILSTDLDIKIPYPTYAYHYKKHFGNIVKKEKKSFTKKSSVSHPISKNGIKENPIEKIEKFNNMTSNVDDKLENKIMIPKYSVFNWIGGKKWLSKKLIDTLSNIKPEIVNNNNKIYIEPFIGGLGSFKAILPFLIKNNYSKIVLNDINPVVIKTYNEIKNNHEELINELTFLNNSYQELFTDIKIKSFKKIKNKEGIYETVEGFYHYSDLHPTRDKEEVRGKFLLKQVGFFNHVKRIFNIAKTNNMIDVKMIAYFIFLMSYCFNGVYRENRAGKYNVPFNWKNKYLNNESLVNPVKEHYKLFSSIEIIFENMDVFELLKKYDDKEATLYLDPPYLNEEENTTENRYNKDEFGLKEQHKLINIAQEYGIVIYSNHNDKRLKDKMNQENWKLEKVYRKNNISSNNESRKKDKEELLATYIK